MEPEVTAPPVVAVVVTRDPGPWFEEVLGGLAAQRYPSMSVLVIDAGSAVDPTPRIAAVLPDAYVHRIEDNPGYARAANEVRHVVEGAVFHLFLHDDVALAPEATETLVAEAFRSNAAIVGPKVLDWDEPQRLVSVGLTVDKTGVPLGLVERGELDQEQHDGVRDVFAIEGGAMLVRADLFEELDGFDEGIDFLGEDIDLCWRAHVIGGRSVVAPQATARHREAMGERRPDDDRRRLQSRHRLRTLLVAYSPWHLFRVLPQAAFVTIVEAVFSVLFGRIGHAREVLGAWTWNFTHRRDLLRRRRSLQRQRRVSDRDLRRLQARGSARVSGFMRGTLGLEARSRLASGGTSARDQLARPSTRAALLVCVSLLVFFWLGNRALIAHGPPRIGGLVPLSSFGDLTRDHLSSWREMGLGSEGPQPVGQLVLAVAHVLSLGFGGLLRTVSVLGPLVAGVIGTGRLISRRHGIAGGLVALTAAAALPLGVDALATGSWSGLLAFAVAPWIVAGVLDAADGRRSPLGAAGGVGLALAVVTALAPGLWLVPVVVGLGMVVAAALGTRCRSLKAGLTSALIMAAIAVVLQLPFGLETFAPHADLAVVMGPMVEAGTGFGVGELIRFDLGPVGSGLLSWALPLAALTPLLIGRDERLAHARAMWGVALSSWALAWVGERGWLPVGLPPAHVVLSVAAVAVAAAIGLGAEAFRTDLHGHRFGWRQATALAGGLLLVVGSLPWVFAAGSGRWHAPRSSHFDVLSWMDEKADEGSFRTVWVGRPRDLPVATWRLADGVGYGVSFDGLPDARQSWVSSADGVTGLLTDALGLALDGRTAQLGRLTGPMAVRYVVVVRALSPVVAPAPLPGVDATVAALDQQVDLRRLPSDPSVAVYENAAWLPRRAFLDATTTESLMAATTIDAVLAIDVAATGPALLTADGRAAWSGARAEAAGGLLVGDAGGSSWHLSADGSRVHARSALGWASAFDLSATEPGADLSWRHRTGPIHVAALGLELLVWVMAVRLWRRQRRAQPAPAAAEVDHA